MRIKPNIFCAGPRSLDRTDLFGLTLIVGLTAILGIGPHAFFSHGIGELAFFKGAYDEDTYTIFMLRKEWIPQRFVSNVLLGLISRSTNESIDGIIILSDFVFPVLAAGLAYQFVGEVVKGLAQRVVLSTIFLFGGDFLSLANSSVWTPNGFVLESIRSSFGSLATLIPRSETPYLTIFRTPEPQVTICVFMAFSWLLVRISAKPEIATRESISLCVVGIVIPFTYIFLSVPCVIILLSMLVYYLRQRNWPTAKSFILALFLAILGYSFFIFTSKRGGTLIFYSRLPVLTPAVILSLVLFSLYIILSKRTEHLSATNWLGLTCLVLPIILCEQQIITGFMVSASNWERYTNYFLICMGSILLIGQLLQNRSDLFLSYSGYSSVALFFVLLFIIINAQVNCFYSFIHTNAVSIAIARAVRDSETRVGAADKILLSDPQIGPLVWTRLQGRRDLILDLTDVFLSPVPRLRPSDSMPVSTEHKSSLFQHWALLGVKPDEVRAILTGEVQSRGGYFCGFLFAFIDCKAFQSDGRSFKEDAMLRTIPQIVADYGEFLSNLPQHGGISVRVVLVTSGATPYVTRPSGWQGPVGSGSALGQKAWVFLPESDSSGSKPANK